MTLNGWQQRLVEHFGSLYLRTRENSRPIFTIEHGLSDSELAELISSLQEHVRWTGPARGHWLVWAVFASEVGYKFAGDQYWQTFAAQLPGWTKHEDRYFIKDAFQKFRRDFGGAQPSGAWANNFTIICWPIVHAVLPKDLQRHLASVLYETRHLFTRPLIETPDALGEFIDAHSLWASSRFKQFASQHDLVGRIASALLRSVADDSDALLSQSTLTRITADLQQEQRSREWLHNARQKADSLTFHGTRGGSTLHGATRSENSLGLNGKGNEEPLFDAEIREQRVDLVAIPVDESMWDLKAVLPDFSALLQATPQFNQVFSTQRSFISGAERSFFPPKYFLFGRRQVVLKSPPSANKPFLRFDNSVPGLSFFLDSVCSIPPFDKLIFRIRDDGTAILAKTTLLRPGHRYLIINSDRVPAGPTLQGSRRVAISCSGIRATVIDVPEYVTSFFHEDASKLGFQVASGLAVRPVGYPAASWDGEGSMEWIVGTPMLLWISADVEVSRLTLHVFGGGISQTQMVPSPDLGGVFVDLEHLPIGEYQFIISARLPFLDDIQSDTILIEVKPPQEKQLDPKRSQRFSVVASPPIPTLEELWRGRATLDLYGPAGARLGCQFHFYSDGDCKNRLLYWAAPELKLPVSSEQWEEYFDQVQQDSNIRSAYDAAEVCRIVFRSASLGMITLECEREFTPFRLLVKRSASAYRLKLLQNDSTEDVSLHLATFEAPNHAISVSNAFKGEITASETGGLYFAERQSIYTEVVIPPIRVKSFAGLNSPILRLTPVNSPDLLSVLATSLKRWSEAQLVGDVLSSRRRQAAISSLQTCFVESVCGGAWVAIEEDVHQGRKSLDVLAAKLGSAQGSSIARLAISGSRQYLEMGSGELVNRLVESWLRISNRVQEPIDSDRIAKLYRYLRIEGGTADPLPELPRDYSSFALNNPSFIRLMRFAAFAETMAMCSTKVFVIAGPR